MTEQETIHVADVSDGIGGDATTDSRLRRSREELYNIT